MYYGFYEEGDKCPECREGKLEYVRDGDCSCHISAPCSACVSMALECNKCGYRPDEPEYDDVPLSNPFAETFISTRVYKPKPLDRTRIDYRIKPHSSSSQICEGVYPEGTTMREVEEVVRGTFGGRFERFRDGKFKYIAYTD